MVLVDYLITLVLICLFIWAAYVVIVIFVILWICGVLPMPQFHTAFMGRRVGA